MSLKEDFDKIARGKRINILGKDDIGNEAHWKVAVALLKAYGDCDNGFIYFEPCLLNDTERPPDIVICHPDTGLLVIEVKGHSIKTIKNVSAGNLIIRGEGFSKPINPIRQAERSMYQIKNLYERLSREQYDTPLFNAVAFLPNIKESEWDAQGYNQSFDGTRYLFNDHCNNPETLRSKIGSYISYTLEKSSKKSPLENKHINRIKSKVFGDSAVINNEKRRRDKSEEDTLGGYLDELSNLEKHLSKDQDFLSRQVIGEHPRLIRGVAGSGKTIVLANMVARLMGRKIKSHHQGELFENNKKLPRVAVVCFNRSLVQFIKNKIKNSCIQQHIGSKHGIDLTITHFNNLMSKLKEGGLWKYIPVPDMKDASERAEVYRSLLQDSLEENPEKQELLFDYIFIDEGQDFHETEIQLIYDLIKPASGNKDKPLVMFYDDAQNLYGRVRPKWSKIEIDVKGRSSVMKECYRNPQPVIELALNVLLGTKSSNPSQVKNKRFADVYYLSERNLLEEEDGFLKVKFAKREGHIPNIEQRSSRSKEKEWVSGKITSLIKDHNVRPEDILVLFNSSKGYENLENLINEKLHEPIEGFVKPYGGNKPDVDGDVFKKNHLTISTIRGAKGHDSYIVFLIGCDQLKASNDKDRALFYVGATRAKMFLHLTGVQTPDSLLNEAKAVRQHMDQHGDAPETR